MANMFFWPSFFSIVSITCHFLFSWFQVSILPLLQYTYLPLDLPLAGLPVCIFFLIISYMIRVSLQGLQWLSDLISIHFDLSPLIFVQSLILLLLPVALYWLPQRVRVFQPGTPLPSKVKYFTNTRAVTAFVIFPLMRAHAAICTDICRYMAACALKKTGESQKLQ